ncbi:NAD(P)H-binding protein [Streptomyces sp. R41]|uniref:NAD(P)H-binding protein n=1 Tax=Streptomyces sp. R41 TaxID=3238632 RepID=A0AB39RK29_9ACTN
MILVTGATGHVGGELVRQLAEAGQPVRAMTRRPAQARFSTGVEGRVETVYGDANDPASLDQAFAGVRGAFLMSSQAVGSAPGPTHDTALAEAAARAGVERLVKLSVLNGGAAGAAGAGRAGGDAGDGADVIARWHATAERAVTSPAKGWAWTLLRPGRFMSNALQWAPAIRGADEVPIPFADRPAASIDPADIAAVACAALTARGDEHAGAAYELSGPRSLTPTEELTILADVLSRPLRVREVPAEATRTAMTRYGFPPEVVEAIMNRTLHDDRGTEVLPTVQKLLDRPARTFAQWARAHAGAFSPSGA